MARETKKVVESSFELDTTPEVTTRTEIPHTPVNANNIDYKVEENPSVVNCLRNDRVIIKHIPKQSGMITNPKHVLYGGMAENAVRVFGVPKLSSGSYVNVLTNQEKTCIEEALGLEVNALSIYKKQDNFWDNFNVRLTKQDTVLNLSRPEDYLKYKVLLANKNIIASSIQELEDHPKASYQFVIINEQDETKKAKQNMSNIQRCYKEFGKIEDDAATLRLIIETITGRATAANTKLDWLQTKVNELIQADSKMFLKIVSDELLPTKVLMKKAIDAGHIAYRGDQLYLRDGNQPLCEYNEVPTLNIAAKFLSNPKHQDILFSLQAKLK